MWRKREEKEKERERKERKSERKSEREVREKAKRKTQDKGGEGPANRVKIGSFAVHSKVQWQR